MTASELKFEIETLGSRIDLAPVSGAELDEEIGALENRLAAMNEVRSAGRDWVARNWIAGRQPAVKATVPEAIDLDPSEFTDDQAAAVPEPVAPIEAGVDAHVHVSKPVDAKGAALPQPVPAPLAPPTSVGIGFDANTGLAFDVPSDDEDLVL